VNYTFASKSYDSLMSNERLSSLYVANGEALGIEFENDPMLLSKQGGSTDMGNVSRVLPSIHPKYSLHTQVSAHTSEFRDIACE
ncbi:peptidase m20 domain-containing protein 2, partial [Plakobranchus ocellatus]